MNSHRFPLATSSWDQAEQDALQRVIESGMFSMGPEVQNFERQFAEFFGVKHAVMVNSGSSANLLMTGALFYSKNSDFLLNPGDEVIVPSVSWSTTYYPLAQYGLVQKFVDVDRNTLNYDLDALESAVTDNTRAIMIVNLLGNPNDFDRIGKIVGDRKIVLLEDNCEAMGATFKGRQAGTFGTVGSFSCFFSHHISTMEGGMVVTDDEELYHIMLSMRSHGWTRHLPKTNHVTGTKSDDAFEESFKFVLPGYNLRPLEMSGALGQAQLKKLPNIIEGRRANAATFIDKLANHPLFTLQHEIGESSWFGFSLLLRPDIDISRSTVVEKLVNLGFECRPIVAGNFAKNPVMQHIPHTVHGSLEGAEFIDANGLFVGNHHYPIPEAAEVLAAL
ncbi:DegT/DnrJ/EryC1/StrS family aminotransferase [Sphingomonadales bacterium 56]|uniref:DegT/DnrJ/EryC1/StrS family aminotransferase n=1 Tax=unclassified Sphingobium TaxID=2611147 RepID=UPI0019182A5C|nr:MULTISPECIES: DegT/DnrJ/EryC1/StrS family aminotransferase [unclassified Sphingobium]MBY2930522.1 DegT/DnrJ/EryC1/StrS family aminotransferase [Sphingomonadales bacterium 56]MBY2960679.1 DegT/DnrJ/EryC1/StrS family aminotransferase [Sphingomonadales bacterium 58]CAD7341477.1 GDP-4-keto-6-deoxy-D-mannose 3-dehydratase [Sphingobium sp. S6]CAD7341738.1 GDP-4-keto-6-deoxy-D-mannose 3-dehydratase [Sphingobium sp. S8]